MSFFSMLASVFQTEIKEPAPVSSPKNSTPSNLQFVSSEQSSQITHKIYTGESENYRTKKYSYNGQNYRILNYEFGQENEGNTNYRSVIVDNESGRILSFSPSRTLSVDEFSLKHPDVSDFSRYLATKTIEGTMIQLFYAFGNWEIATRTAVGGDYSFFQKTPKKTFRDMFLDVFNAQSTWTADEYGNVARDMNDVDWFSVLDPKYSYTFVLQHPDNHLVFPVITPKLYLVSVHEIRDDYDVENQTQNVRFVPFHEYSAWDFIQIGIQQGFIAFPPVVAAQFTVEGYYGENCCASKAADKVGIMICDQQTGDRIHLENEGYKRLKELRGNDPNFISTYIRLIRTGNVKDFILAFPMYREECYRLYSTYHNLITAVHTNYMAYYVHKDKSPIDKAIFVHVARIHHNIYLASGEEKRKITHRIVREYFDNMDEGTLFHLLSKYTA